MTTRSDPPPSRATKADLRRELGLLEADRERLLHELATLRVKLETHPGLERQESEIRHALNLAGIPAGTLVQRVGFALHDLDALRNRVAAAPEPWGVWLWRLLAGVRL